MVLDYSNRKPVAKNRPRKQSVGIFTIVLISAVFMSFTLGVLTGWFIFKPSRKAAQIQAATGAGSQPGDAAAKQGRQQNPESSAGKGGEPPLTFYDTLPKGGKVLIGSGLNPQKENPASPLPAVVPRTAAASPPQPAVGPPPAKEGERREPAKQPAEQTLKSPVKTAPLVAVQPGVAGKYCVQVASTRDKQEAESLKERLVGKGLAAYIVESQIKERGTWYRVRVGKHLSQQLAGELAAKAGSGAMVIPE